MSEQLENIEEIDDNLDTQDESGDEQQEQPQYTELEQQALAQGWNPNKSKSAEQWLEDGDFKKRIMQKLETVEKMNLDLVANNARVRYEGEKAGYQKALHDLQIKQIEASRIGDDEEVARIQGEIINKAQVIAQKFSEPPSFEQPQPQAPQFSQDDVSAFQSWVGQNQWYNSDHDLKIAAQGMYSAAEARGLSVKEALKEVSNRMKQAFPERLGYQPPRGGGVEGQGSVGRAKPVDKTNPASLPKEWRGYYDKAKQDKVIINDKASEAWLRSAWQIIDAEKKS